MDALKNMWTGFFGDRAKVETDVRPGVTVNKLYVEVDQTAPQNIVIVKGTGTSVFATCAVAIEDSAKQQLRKAGFRIVGSPTQTDHRIVIRITKLESKSEKIWSEDIFTKKKTREDQIKVSVAANATLDSLTSDEELGSVIIKGAEVLVDSPTELAERCSDIGKRIGIEFAKAIKVSTTEGLQ